MRIAAIAVTVFWLLSVVFVAITYQTIDGNAGRFIMGMASVCVLLLAILETVRKRAI